VGISSSSIEAFISINKLRAYLRRFDHPISNLPLCLLAVAAPLRFLVSFCGEKRTCIFAKSGLAVARWIGTLEKPDCGSGIQSFRKWKRLLRGKRKEGRAGSPSLNNPGST